MSSLDRILSHAEEFLLGVLLATASLVLFVNVVARYIFNWGFPWAEELVRYEIVWMVFLGGSAAADLPPPLPGIARQLILARLVLRWTEQRRGDGSAPDAPPEDQAVRLAGELGRLVDSVETEGLDFAELDKLVPEDYAVHWQKTLDFLRIVTGSWPEIQMTSGGGGCWKLRPQPGRRNRPKVR